MGWLRKWTNLSLLTSQLNKLCCHILWSCNFIAVLTPLTHQFSISDQNYRHGKQALSRIRQWHDQIIKSYKIFQLSPSFTALTFLKISGTCTSGCQSLCLLGTMSWILKGLNKKEACELWSTQCVSLSILLFFSNLSGVVENGGMLFPCTFRKACSAEDRARKAASWVGSLESHRLYLQVSGFPTFSSGKFLIETSFMTWWILMGA